MPEAGTAYWTEASQLEVSVARRGRATARGVRCRASEREEDAEDDADQRAGKHLDGRVPDQLVQTLFVEAALGAEVVPHDVEEARLLPHCETHAVAEIHPHASEH